MEVQETWSLTEAFSETFLFAPHSWKFEMRDDNLYAVLGRGKLMVLGQLPVGEPVDDWTAVVILTIPDVPKV
jgi:hypothetical protein